MDSFIVEFASNMAQPVYSHHAARCGAPLALHLVESSPDGPGRLGRHPVDSPVEEDHDSHGGKEGSDGAVEDISRITGKDALGVTMICDHPAAMKLRITAIIIWSTAPLNPNFL